VLLLPDYGVGVFAFANRTYAGPSGPVWDAAVALHKAGLLKPRALPVSDALAAAYRAAAAAYVRGSITAAGDRLAMNVLLDRSAEGWSRDLERLRKQVGACETTAPIRPNGALSGEFTWTCAHGRVKGSLLLAPTRPPTIQELRLEPAAP
jgi:hypothetical protein